MLRVTTITRCFNTSSSVGTLNVFTPPLISIKQYWTEDESSFSHKNNSSIKYRDSGHFRYILKWKSCYSLVFHAIQVISTDLKFKNFNSTPYMYVLIVQTLYRKITSMLSFFMHLKHAPPNGTKTSVAFIFPSKSTRYLGDLRFPQQSRRVFWSSGMWLCVAGFESPPTFQRNIQH